MVVPFSDTLASIGVDDVQVPGLLLDLTRPGGPAHDEGAVTLPHLQWLKAGLDQREVEGLGVPGPQRSAWAIDDTAIAGARGGFDEDELATWFQPLPHDLESAPHLARIGCTPQQIGRHHRVSSLVGRHHGVADVEVCQQAMCQQTSSSGLDRLLIGVVDPELALAGQ